MNDVRALHALIVTPLFHTSQSERQAVLPDVDGARQEHPERKPTRNTYLLDSLALTVKARFPVSVGTPTPADEAEETQRGYHHDGGFGLGDRRDNHVAADTGK